MGRKRLAMELISNKRARLISMEKRKKSLKKSAHDLSTLCGVEIGMLIVSDQDSEVWPNLDTVHKLLPHQDERRTYGVLDYFKEKREKVEGEMKKMRESKYPKWDNELGSFSHDQLRELDCFLKAKIGAVREKINSRRAFASSRNPELVEEEQILGCNCNSCLSTEFIRNPYLQESGFYCEGQSNNPYLNMNTEFAMNPCYLEESEVYMFQQHHQQMAEINNVGNQSEMVMMNSHGESCSQSCIYNFHQSQDSYGHLLEENWFQNCGRQTEMMRMENFGTNDVEPLMSYDMVPNEEVMMLQNWQGLVSFPEGNYV